MHPEIHPGLAKCLTTERDDGKSLVYTGDSITPLGAVEVTRPNPTPKVGPEAKLWQPRHYASHLFKSANGTWYMRLTVPAAIRALHPELPKEFKRSTETAEKRRAEARAREMCIEFSIRYTTGAAMPTPDISAKNSFSITYADGALGVANFQGASPDTLLLMGRCLQLLTRQIIFQGRNHADLPEPENAPTTPWAPPMQSNNIVLPINTENIRPVAAEKIQTSSIWLSDAIDDWQKNGSGRFNQVTWNTVYRPSFRVLREILGNRRRDRETDDGRKELGVLDIQLHELTRQHIVELRQCLQELPPNQGKRTNDTEAIERIALGRKQKSKPPTRMSVAKKLSHIGGFLEYCKRKGWIGPALYDEYKLAVEGALKDANQESDKRSPGYVALNPDEIRRTYEQPAFLIGAVMAAWRYWVPLICLYQGCRVSEASQLFTDDIIYRDDVPCISFINDETIDFESNTDDAKSKAVKTGSKRLQKTYKSAEEYRRLKTKSSRRVVPIHPKLIELGFLNFVTDFDVISPRPQHLFSDLRWEEKSMFGRCPSRHILNLLKESGVWVKRKKVGHSLRSNFKQEIEKTGLSENLQQRLLGHSPNTMKDKHYNETDDGPAYPAAQVLPFLSMVNFRLNLPAWAEVKAQMLINARVHGLARINRRNVFRRSREMAAQMVFQTKR